MGIYCSGTLVRKGKAIGLRSVAIPAWSRAGLGVINHFRSAIVYLVYVHLEPFPEHCIN